MKILFIAYPNLKKDPRPYRQIKSLYKDYEIHTIGGEDSGLEEYFYKIKKHKFYVEILRIFLLKFGLYKRYYWDRYKKQVKSNFINKKYDLVVAHEIRLVPLAIEIAKGAPIILDAHEYSPKNFDDSWAWRFFIKKYYTKLCEDYLPKVKKVITVSQGIVEAYQENFGTDTVLITNASEYVSHLTPTGVDKNKIRIIHHGIAGPSRKLELLVQMMNHLDNNKYELNLMLVSSTYSQFYVNKLKKMSRGLNINFLEPVKRSQLIDFSNQFDVGVHFVPPTNFNLKYGLGNKFFEFIQSRLAVVIGPDIEMSRYVKKYDLGMIAEDWTPKSLAKSISGTNVEKLTFYKNQSHKFAKELSSDFNDKVFKEIIKSFEKK